MARDALLGFEEGKFVAVIAVAYGTAKEQTGGGKSFFFGSAPLQHQELLTPATATPALAGAPAARMPSAAWIALFSVVLTRSKDRSGTTNHPSNPKSGLLGTPDKDRALIQVSSIESFSVALAPGPWQG